MRTILTALHDVWCVITARCRISMTDDPLMQELRQHELTAWREVGKLRNERTQRPNPVEDAYLPHLRRKGAHHGRR